MQREGRPVVPAMRWVFIVGSLLVFAAFVQLFVLTDHTDRFFAWTIAPGASAAFLGAFYGTAFVLAGSCALEREWTRARVGVFGVWLFVTLTLIATLLHLGKFHFHDPDAVAKGAAWLWTVIYAVEPPAVLIAIALQLGVPGTDLPRKHVLPAWYRGLFIAHALLLTVVGVEMLVAPTSLGWWPWTLTPLVARAMSAWILGLAIVLATGAWENDWARIRLATRSYVVLGVLQLVAVARYGDDLGGGTSTIVYVAFLALVTATGAAGMVLGQPQ